MWHKKGNWGSWDREQVLLEEAQGLLYQSLDDYKYSVQHLQTLLHIVHNFVAKNIWLSTVHKITYSYTIISTFITACNIQSRSQETSNRLLTTSTNGT